MPRTAEEVQGGWWSPGRLWQSLNTSLSAERELHQPGSPPPESEDHPLLDASGRPRPTSSDADLKRAGRNAQLAAAQLADAEAGRRAKLRGESQRSGEATRSARLGFYAQVPLVSRQIAAYKNSGSERMRVRAPG